MNSQEELCRGNGDTSPCRFVTRMGYVCLEADVPRSAETTTKQGVPGHRLRLAAPPKRYAQETEARAYWSAKKGGTIP